MLSKSVNIDEFKQPKQELICTPIVTNQQDSNLNALPAEIKKLIILNLVNNRFDILNLLRTCKQFSQYLQDFDIIRALKDRIQDFKFDIAAIVR